MTAVLHQLQSEGLIRSYVDDHGHLRWMMTELGKTFQSLIAEHADEAPLSSRVDVDAGATVSEVASPHPSGKLVVDIGPGVRMRLSQQAVPDHVELGLLNLVPGETQLLEEVTPAHPQRVRLDIGMAQARPRSKISKAEFELVGCSIGIAGLFDLQGRLRWYGALINRGEGQCAVPSGTICPKFDSQGEEQ